MDDSQLELKLRQLYWIESKFDNARWVPKDLVPSEVKAALENRHGRFFGPEHIYYLSQAGNVSRYRYESPDLPKAADYGKTVLGVKLGKPLCPECGEPLDTEHRGQHNH